MIRFIVIVVALIATYGASVFLLGKTNMTRERRYLQASYVFVATIYSIFFSVAFIFLLGCVDAIMSLDFIKTIVLEGVPAKNYGAGFMLLITLFCNTIFMLGSVIVFFVLKGKISGKTNYETNGIGLFLEKFANNFYEIDESDGWPFLRNKHVMTAKWLDVMRKGIIIICGVWLVFATFKLYAGFLLTGGKLLAALKYFMILFSATYLPITELHYFLKGVCKDEDITEFEIDEVRLERKGNYERLVNYYCKKYGDLIINSDKPVIDRSHVDEYMFNDISNEMLNRSNNKNAFVSIINSIKYNCEKLSENYTEATLSLVNRQNIIINDSIYGEALLYLAGYFNYKIALGCKVLIVTAEENRVENIVKEIKDRLKRINDINPIWQVSKIEENWSDTADILVCSVNKLEYIGNREFIKYIGCIVVDDPSGSFVSGTVAEKMVYINSIGFNNNKLQFIFLNNEDNRNLEEALEHIIGGQVYTFKNSNSKKSFYCISWKNESYNQAQTRIGINPYIGQEQLIAIEAARMGVKHIGVWVNGSVPYVTYHDYMMQNFDEIKQKVLKDDTINMNNIVSYNNSGDYRKGLYDRVKCENYENNNLKFIISFDVDNNLLPLARTWRNYILNENTVIVIVSSNYLLRGYLADNLNTLVQSPNTIKQIIPFKGEDKHRTNELLLLRLYKGLRSDVLIESYNNFNRTNYKFDEIEECLEELLNSLCPSNLYTNVYNSFTFSPDSDFSPKESNYGHSRYYNVKLTNSKIYDYIINKKNYAQVRFGASDDVIYTPIGLDDIYNYYLPSQIHCFEGELAVVKEINKKGEILVEKTTPKTNGAYVQNINYLGQKCRNFDGIIDVEERYNISTFDMQLSWDIQGYYTLTAGNNLFDKKDDQLIKTYEYINLMHPISVDRKLRKGTLITFYNKCDINKFELTITYILNELFKTLFPNNYNDIAALVIKNERLTSFINELNDEEKIISDFIPQIEIEEIEESENPRIVIIEKSFVEKGIVSEIIDRDNLRNIFEIVQEYLLWETTTNNQKAKYLNFGNEEYPSLFDVFDVIDYLKKVCSSRKINQQSDFDDYEADKDEYCPYCGRRLGVEYVETDDGRCMCVECRNQVVYAQKEIKEIYKEAYDKLKQIYTLKKMPENIRGVRLKKLTELIKATGNDNILGFYDSNSREIWVVKGVPRAYEYSTFAHELVHAWQYVNFGRKALDNKDLLEGHAMWVEIEMCRKMHQDSYADYLEYCLENGYIIATYTDKNGKEEEFSYSVGYMEMKRRMSLKRDAENSFDIALQWANEIENRKTAMSNDVSVQDDIDG